jgi:hypothetical protein
MTETVTVAPAPPGWYLDPEATGRLRWWTGATWSEHVQPFQRSGDDVAVAVLVGAVRTYPTRALVWGIIATVIANVLAGILAIVYGAISLSRAGALEAQGLESGRQRALVGLILGIVGTLGGICWLAAISVLAG